MVFTACTGQTHYKSIWERVLPASCRAARFCWMLLCWWCAIPGACNLLLMRIGTAGTNFLFKRCCQHKNTQWRWRIQAVCMHACALFSLCSKISPAREAGSLRFQLKDFSTSILMSSNQKPLQSVLMSPQTIGLLLADYGWGWRGSMQAALKS